MGRWALSTFENTCEKTKPKKASNSVIDFAMKINLNHFVNVNMSDPLSLLRRLFVKTRSSLSASLSAEEFIQNRHFILQILRKLLRKYQVEPKYIIRFPYNQAFTSMFTTMFTFRFIDSFLPQDAVYLILLMRIICDIQLQQKKPWRKKCFQFVISWSNPL